MPRHNETEIQKGIKVFKHYADDVEQVRGANGNKHWRGTTDTGGGARIRHTLNEDNMTPSYVMHALRHKAVKDKAEEAYNKAIDDHYKHIY